MFGWFKKKKPAPSPVVEVTPPPPPPEVEYSGRFALAFTAANGANRVIRSDDIIVLVLRLEKLLKAGEVIGTGSVVFKDTLYPDAKLPFSIRVSFDPNEHLINITNPELVKKMSYR